MTNFPTPYQCQHSCSRYADVIIEQSLISFEDFLRLCFIRHVSCFNHKILYGKQAFRTYSFDITTLIYVYAPSEWFVESFVFVEKSSYLPLELHRPENSILSNIHWQTEKSRTLRRNKHVWSVCSYSVCACMFVCMNIPNKINLL